MKFTDVLHVEYPYLLEEHMETPLALIMRFLLDQFISVIIYEIIVYNIAPGLL